MAKKVKGPRKDIHNHPFSTEISLLSGDMRAGLWNGAKGFQSSEIINKTFIAVDEVGRGCLAGPIVVCATLWRICVTQSEHPQWVFELRDSKKLSPGMRENLFKQIANTTNIPGPWEIPTSRVGIVETEMEFSKGKEVSQAAQLLKPISVSKFTEGEIEDIRAQPYSLNLSCSLMAASIGAASAACIDQCGIISGLGVAASEALSQLPSIKDAKVIFFDGNRPLPLTSPWAARKQILITKGDDLLKSISTSSIIGKVVRDRWMLKYSEYFPEFNLNENKGYGTENHRSALCRLGPTPIHRTSFLKNICPELLP